MSQIIPLDPTGRVSEAFNVRLEELGVIDIALMAGRWGRAAVNQLAANKVIHT
jgi:hypothetical protein